MLGKNTSLEEKEIIEIGAVRLKITAIVVLFLLAVTGCNETGESKSHTEKIRVNHVVLCWLKDSGNKQKREMIINASKKLAKIPGVIEVRVGSVIPSERKIVDDSFDVGIYMTFKSVEDMNGYIVHPDHQRIVQEELMPVVEKIVVYDFEEAGFLDFITSGAPNSLSWRGGI